MSRAQFFSSLSTPRDRHMYPHHRDGETEAQEVQGTKATWPWLAPKVLVSEPSSAHGVIDPCLYLLRGI